MLNDIRRVVFHGAGNEPVSRSCGASESEGLGAWRPTAKFRVSSPFFCMSRVSAVHNTANICVGRASLLVVFRFRKPVRRRFLPGSK